MANLLVAVGIIAGFAMAYGVPNNPPVIGGFAPGSVAQAAGLRVGDRITAVDGAKVLEHRRPLGRLDPWLSTARRARVRQRPAEGVA